MTIIECTPADREEWIALRIALWPEYPPEELHQGIDGILADPDKLVLIHRSETGLAADFAEASIRRDYVNGCETSPVTFLEGIYVAPEHRKRGVAKALAEAAADWGRTRDCTEFASDAYLDSKASHAFHAAIGFEETERVVYFRKAL